MMTHFDIPLNLAHAGRIAERICRLIEARAFGVNLGYLELSATAERLETLLRPYRDDNDDGEGSEAEQVRQEAAALGRQFTDQIECLGLGEDRVGQCIRNLFECLALGKEGAMISLRAGENPSSLQRPG